MLKCYSPVFICSAFKGHAEVLAYVTPFEFNERYTQTSEMRTGCPASVISKVLRMEVQRFGREEALSISSMLLSWFRE